MTVGLLVQRRQRFHDFVEANRRTAGIGAKLRRCLHGTGIGRPRREDRALFVERQLGIIDDLGRVTERLRGMQQFVEVESARDLSFMSFLLQVVDHLIWMVRGFARSTFGKTSDRTPSFISAPILL